MARVNLVKKARIAQGKCGRCGVEIKRGDPYRWTKPRYGSKRVRCMRRECRFRPSDLTSSDNRAAIFAAQESVEDAIEAVRKMEKPSKTVVETLCVEVGCASEEIRQTGELYGESADNIEQYFSESETIDECRENADACDAVADALGAFDFDEVLTLYPEEGEPDEETWPQIVTKVEDLLSDLDTSYEVDLV